MAVWFYILKARILHWRIPFGIQKSRTKDEESFPLFISYSCWLTNSEVKWEVGTWGWILGVDSADSLEKGKMTGIPAWQEHDKLLQQWFLIGLPWLVVGVLYVRSNWKLLSPSISDLKRCPRLAWQFNYAFPMHCIQSGQAGGQEL